MREYGSDICFICLESQTSAKKRFSLNVLFIALYSLFRKNSIHSRYYLWWHVLWRFNHSYVEP